MMLVDTNVISELMRQRPNPNVLDWLADQQRRARLSGAGVPRWYVTFITVEEIQYGLASIAEHRVTQRRVAGHRATQELLDWFERFLAATALESGLTLVTRNVRDFEDCLISLWDSFLDS